MAKLIYSSVIRPAITYGAAIWYSPQGITTACKGVERRLDMLQAKSLRSVLGAYKAVNPQVLEKEANIPPLDSVIGKLITKTVQKLMNFNATRTVTNACKKIQSRVIGSRSRRIQAKQSPRVLQIDWVSRIVSQDTWSYEVLPQTAPRQRRSKFKSEIHKTAEDD